MDSLNARVAAVFRTVITGDQDQIQEAINNYRDPPYHRYYLYQKKDGDGRNLLHYVCMYNTDEVATWMLSLRNDVDSKTISQDSDKFGVTAVMYAARAGMVTFVTEWIQQKYDINTVDKNGRNILHYCSGEGEIIPDMPEAKQKYIDKKYVQQVAHILIINGINFSRLQNAEKLEIKNIIDLNFDQCLKLNPSDGVKARQMWKISQEAKMKLCPGQIYSPGIEEWEANGGLMHVCVTECFTPNLSFSNKQRIAMFDERIKICKPDINELDDNGMTALHYLCYYRFDWEPYGLREILVGKLLELGADPNIKDIKGCTPLMCGIDKGYVKKYDAENPRYANEKGIGKLLNVEMGEVETDVKVIVKQNENMMEQMKAREELYRQELDKINKRLTQKLNDTTEQLNNTTEQLKITTEQLNNTTAQLNNTTEQLNNTRQDLAEIKTSKDQLHERLGKQCKQIDDLQLKMKDLGIKTESEQQNIEVPPSSLLLSNLVLSDVTRHLEADVEVTCLADASLGDLEATISKDDQKYRNVYLITENKCTSSELNNLFVQYRKLIDASKDKATKLIVSSVLPTLDDGDVNDNIEHLNKELETLCQETACQFVNNDNKFKFMNGTIIEACFDEDGESLCEFGIKQLLKNLGLLTVKKKKMQATNN